MKKYADELVYTYDKDYSLTGAIRMDITFSSSLGMQEKLEKVIEDAGYSTDESDPDYVANNVNWAYVSGSGDSDPTTMGAVGGGLLLVILTGYLIIYNIFQISVIRDIQYYGLLKTIGATGRQVKKMIRRQALRLGIMGIVPGLALGYVCGPRHAAADDDHDLLHRRHGDSPRCTRPSFWGRRHLPSLPCGSPRGNRHGWRRRCLRWKRCATQIPEEGEREEAVHRRRQTAEDGSVQSGKK